MLRFIKTYIFFHSGSSENSYPTQADNSNTTTPHQNGFLSRSPQKIQTEPVDFSGNQPVDFSGPRMGFGIIGPTPYSRESTPDSGGSHYIDNFRDPSGKTKTNKQHAVYLLLFYRILIHKSKQIYHNRIEMGTSQKGI